VPVVLGVRIDRSLLPLPLFLLLGRHDGVRHRRDSRREAEHRLQVREQVVLEQIKRHVGPLLLLRRLLLGVRGCERELIDVLLRGPREPASVDGEDEATQKRFMNDSEP